MQNNIEKQIIDAFSKNSLSITSSDILNKIPPKKEKRKWINWSFITIGVASTLTAAFLIISFFSTNQPNIQNEIEQTNYLQDLIGAVNILNQTQATNEKSIKRLNSTSLTSDYILSEAYDAFHNIAINNINASELKYHISEEENNLFDITYSYKAVIEDNLYNQNYVFLYNLNNQELSGVIYNTFFSDHVLFSIKVESDFVTKDNNIFTSSTFTPQMIGQSIPYSFTISELEKNHTSYSYYLNDQLLYNYTLSSSNSSTFIEYKTSILEFEFNCLFEMKKNSETTYQLNYDLNSLLFSTSGSFTVVYNENGEYEIFF